MRKILWKRHALDDLKSIIEYIADDNPDAALALRDEIVDKVNKLINNPNLYRAGRVAGTRELIVRKNYLVIYTINDEQIVLLRIIHAAQNWPTTK